MIEYPKIETLYNRDPKTFKVDVNELRLAEFGNIKSWYVTEKIDGTNVRIGLSPEGTVTFGGRTDKAQLPNPLLVFLQSTFTPEKMRSAFKGNTTICYLDVTLFGEGYGEKIQNGGGYRSGVSFRLFDVLIDKWWLEPENIQDVADSLGIKTVPLVRESLDFLPKSVQELGLALGRGDRTSWIPIPDGGTGHLAEGIVARTSPMLFTRSGERLMWKLKFKDFAAQG